MTQLTASGPVHKDTLLETAALRPRSQSYVRRVVPLLSRGLLTMTLPDIPHSMAQRYVPTDAGRVYLDERALPEEPR